MDHYTSRNVQHRIVAQNHTSLLLQHAHTTLAAETAEKALCVREVLVMFTSAVKAEMWGPHSV